MYTTLENKKYLKISKPQFVMLRILWYDPQATICEQLVLEENAIKRIAVRERGIIHGVGEQLRGQHSSCGGKYSSAEQSAHQARPLGVGQSQRGDQHQHQTQTWLSPPIDYNELIAISYRKYLFDN